MKSLAVIFCTILACTGLLMSTGDPFMTIALFFALLAICVAADNRPNP